jgi:proprotein convertase subtilisin/kexin type 5
MGFYLFQGYCVSKCPSATFASGGRCQADPCLAYSSTNTCLICASPYLLYKNISTTSPSITCVLSCPTNAIQAGLYCSPCPTQCNNCISTSICTNCSSNTYLYLGICLYSCPIGTYAYNSVCQNCSSLYCSQCTFQNGGEVCTSCDLSSGSFLSNGSCVLVCPTGTYG